MKKTTKPKKLRTWKGLAFILRADGLVVSVWSNRKLAECNRATLYSSATYEIVMVDAVERLPKKRKVKK